MVIAGLALVFAMTGGAYAAKKYLITSTKQISPSVLKSLQGKAGPAGPAGAAGAGTPGAQGPAGPQGPAGKDGANGTNGKDGTNGTNGKEGSQGATGLKGAAGVTGAVGVTGPAGSPWTLGGTLPKGATETGAWSTLGGEFGGPSTVTLDLSFTVPLTEALSGEHVHLLKEGETDATHCTGGTAASPKANEGELCVYTASGAFSELESAIEKAGAVAVAETGASRSGAFLLLAGLEKQGIVHGTWAVTGK
jgi:hypothetical protein